MEMKGKKKCMFYILVPLVAGAAAGMISGSGMAAYEQMAKPPLSPPGWVFPGGLDHSVYPHGHCRLSGGKKL